MVFECNDKSYFEFITSVMCNIFVLSVIFDL